MEVRKSRTGCVLAWVGVESLDNAGHVCTCTCFNILYVCSSSACVCMHPKHMHPPICSTCSRVEGCQMGVSALVVSLHKCMSVCTAECACSRLPACTRARTHTHSSVWISSWAPDFLPLWHMISLGSLRYHPRTKGDLNAAERLSSAHATVNQRQLKRALPAKAATMIYE